METEAVWDSVSDIVKDSITEFKLSKMKHGMIVFKIIPLSIKKPKEQINDYKKATKKYKEKLEKTMIEKYKMIQMDIKIKLFRNELYEGKKVKTDISFKVFRRLVELASDLKQFKIKQPEYILYWKKDRLTVWFAFISDKQAEQYRDMIMDRQYDQLRELIPWSGAKTKFIKDEFMSYYKETQDE